MENCSLLESHYTTLAKETCSVNGTVLYSLFVAVLNLHHK